MKRIFNDYYHHIFCPVNNKQDGYILKGTILNCPDGVALLKQRVKSVFEEIFFDLHNLDKIIP